MVVWEKNALIGNRVKPTVHLSEFENKCFPLNANLLGRLFQTGKIQTKTETMEQNMRWQGSSSKRLFLRIAGVYSLLERSETIY